MSLREYKPGTTFPGVIDRTVDVSSPAWPRPNRPKKDAPNVIFIVLDDTGFGQLGCFGSPIQTPNLDALAAGGLRYANFHTTALCSPTRACLITGRNHHSNSMACITEGATGFPGSNGQIPFENGFLSEILVQNGYNTYAVGKWHLTPAHEMSAAGPYDRWPLGRGFQRFYGFLGGDTHQYYPELVYDNHQVEPEKTPEFGYHLTEDLVDKAIAFIADAKQVDPDRPFFLYFATGAMHAPHHVPPEWIEKYQGQFDDGWDSYREKVFLQQKELGVIPPETELSRHDPDVKPWAECTPDERKVYARMMEVFAGFLEHTDNQIGRLWDFLKRINAFENTLIVALSDNGASSEGGPNGMINVNMWHNNLAGTLEDNLAVLDELGGPKHFNHYAWGWTFAGNTPFRRWKRETYRGGISDPMIVHWPARIKAKNEVRFQYTHAIDVVPTVLDCLDIEPPATIRGVTQSPLEGVSFLNTFNNGEGQRHTQYFEMMGHRSIYHDGWRAVCPWPGPSFTEAGKFFGVPITAEALTQLDANGWELYHVAEDWAENHNLARERYDKLIEMISLWYIEAGKYNVLPIDARGSTRIIDPRPQAAPARERYTFFPGTQVVPGSATVNVINRPHSITAEVDIPESGAEGVLLSFGGSEGGYSFYLQDDKLHYAQNVVSAQLLHVESVETVPQGRHSLRFEFEPTGQADIKAGKGVPGQAQLYIDDRLVGQTNFPFTVPITYGLGGGIACGADSGSPVTNAYQPPFPFTGKLYEVMIDVSGDLIRDEEAEIRLVMARQ
jgi:arylsulfatase A-like enzyme